MMGIEQIASRMVTMKMSFTWRIGVVAAMLASFAFTAVAQNPRRQRPEPPWAHAAWMNKSLSADERADLVIKELSLDE